MSEDQASSRSEILALTAKIVAAQVSNNTTGHDEMLQLIQSVFNKLTALDIAEPAVTALTPAVPIRKSVTDAHIICLEDGRKLKMLKRYLMSAYEMTPEQYRAKWGLPGNYPMVAPAHARRRQELAKKIGFGRKKLAEPAPKATRSRAKATS